MTNSISQEQIEQIAINDYCDYATIVLQYYKMLHRYACRVIPFKTEAEEIVIQTMLSLWLDRKRLHSPDAVRMYLKKHTKQLCMNWLYYKTINRKKNHP